MLPEAALISTARSLAERLHFRGVFFGRRYKLGAPYQHSYRGHGFCYFFCEFHFLPFQVLQFRLEFCAQLNIPTRGLECLRGLVNIAPNFVEIYVTGDASAGTRPSPPPELRQTATRVIVELMVCGHGLYQTERQIFRVPAKGLNRDQQQKPATGPVGDRHNRRSWGPHRRICI